MYVLRFREALAVGVRLAIIHHGDLESSQARRFVEAQRYVPGPEDVQLGGWNHGLDKDVQRPATDQPRIVLGVAVEVEGQCARLLLLHDFTRRLPDFSFHTAAADGAYD